MDWKAKQERFVEQTAKDILAGMSQDDKDYMILHPDPYEHHFGLGLFIRNKYIHGKELGFFYGDPDDLSHEIIQRLISLLKTLNAD